MDEEKIYKDSRAALPCKGIRCKLFFMYSVPIVLAIIIISLIGAVYHLKIARREATTYLQAITQVISDIVGDHLVENQLPAIENHLESIKLIGLKEILVLSPTGKVLAAKKDKHLVGSYYKLFCLLRHNQIYRKDDTIFVLKPIFENHKFLGYVLLVEDLRLLNKVFAYHMHLMCARIVALILIILFISYLISHKLQNIIRKAVFYLRHIGEGHFDLPYEYTSGDDIAQLFNEIKRTAEHLKNTVILKDYYRGLLDAIPFAIVVTDANGIIKEVNKSLLKTLETTEEKLLGRPLDVLCDELKDAFHNRIKDKPTPLEVRLKATCKGKEMWISVSVNRVRDVYIMLIEDITQEVLEEMKLKELAATDPLTGLLNKNSFWLHLEKEFEKASHRNGIFSLLVIDMDNFKEVNDTYGHDFGDEVLKRIAEVLKRSFRNGDILARYGGDEFCVILKNVDKEMALSLAQRFVKNLKEAQIKAPDGKILKLEASFGIATYPEDAQDPRELFRIADREMYKNKTRKSCPLC